MKTAAKKDELYRLLPSVDEVVRLGGVASQVDVEGHAAVADAARTVLGRMRAEIANGRLTEAGVNLALTGLAEAVGRELRKSLEQSLRPVINATGVVLHTNLGRAPLGNAALEHIREIAGTYSNLEYKVEEGERGKRDVHVQGLLARLLGEHAPETQTVVVNNNAAAVLIGLNTLAEGGEVIVSRGELVEIGGSFRVPDVMAKSGAIMREVGTTNRTRIGDYRAAIGEKTRLLLRVHRSNFEITGFTEQASLEDLVALGRERGIPVMEDLGSGALFDLREAGIAGEATVGDSLRAGVDVVTYSGDKLLGGPQAGLLSGRRETIAQIRQNPLFRALRVDKLTYAALEATLLAYVKRDWESIPAVRMLRMTADEIGQRAEALVNRLRAAKIEAEVIAGESLPGGGAAPSATLPTRLLAVTVHGLNADELAARLRRSDPPIVTRVEDGRVLLDLRTVFPEQEEAIIAGITAAAGSV